MGGEWEVLVCSRCSLAVGRSGNKEEGGETVMITNRAREMLQQHANQPACKRQEAPADDRRLTRGGGNEWAG
jgi:hypothetical protein